MAAARTARRMEPQVQSRPQVTVIQGSKQKAKQLLIIGVRPMKIVLTCLLLGMIASVCLCCKAVLTETVNEISVAVKELEVLQSENVRLNMELEAMVSLKNIEEYATEQLGLSKLEKYQVSYVTLDEGERVVTTQGDQGFHLLDQIKEGFDILSGQLS